MVMGDDSCLRGRGFESQNCMQEMTFFTLIWCKNCIVCLKRPKINRKRGRGWLIKKIFAKKSPDGYFGTMVYTMEYEPKEPFAVSKLSSNISSNVTIPANPRSEVIIPTDGATVASHAVAFKWVTQLPMLLQKWTSSGTYKVPKCNEILHQVIASFNVILSFCHSPNVLLKKRT